jgi:hypothetical protein
LLIAAFTLKYTIRAVEDKAKGGAINNNMNSPTAAAAVGGGGMLPPPRPIESPPPAGSWMGMHHQNSPRGNAFPLPHATSGAHSPGFTAAAIHGHAGGISVGVASSIPASPNAGTGATKGAVAGRFSPLPRPALQLITTSSAGIYNGGVMSTSPRHGRRDGPPTPHTPSSARVAPFGISSMVSNGSTASNIHAHSHGATVSSAIVSQLSSLSASPVPTLSSTFGATTGAHAHLHIPAFTGPPTSSIGGTPLAPLPSTPHDDSGPTSPILQSMPGDGGHTQQPLEHVDTGSGSNSDSNGVMIAPSDTSFGQFGGGSNGGGVSSLGVRSPSPTLDISVHHREMTRTTPPSIVPAAFSSSGGHHHNNGNGSVIAATSSVTATGTAPIHIHATVHVNDAPSLVLPAPAASPAS